MTKNSHDLRELREFMLAMGLGLTAGLLTWLVTYSLAALIFPQITGVPVPRLLSLF